MAIEMNCAACEELRQTSPEFVINGITDEMCASLGNGTGLVPTDDRGTIEDLNDINDCLIGNMAKEVSAYQTCDWKTFMKRFIPNLWTTLKAILCAINGIFAQISSVAFVRYFRNNGEGGGSYWHSNLSEGDTFTIDIYMDADGDNAGSQEADRDYVVIINNCTNFRHFRELEVLVTFYASDDTRDLATIRDKQAQHPTFNQPTDNRDIQTFSWTTSGAILVKKGAHVKVNSYVGYVGSNGNDAEYRLHQYVLTWIPANISGSISS